LGQPLGICHFWCQTTTIFQDENGGKLTFEEAFAEDSDLDLEDDDDEDEEFLEMLQGL
jgi:hypothetical protein